VSWPFPHPSVLSIFLDCKMPTIFDYEFKTPTLNKRVTFPTGLYINGQFVEGVEGKTIE